jgi:hypothetical protein
MSRLDAMAGKQLGDPARAAQALLAVVDAERPPLHLLLGSDALHRAREKLDEVIEEMDRWEEVTCGTDFPREEEVAMPSQGQPLDARAVPSNGHVR